MTITKQNIINLLTPRQLELVERYAKGATYGVLATDLGCSTNNVSKILMRARRSVGVSKTAEICHFLGLDCIGHKPTEHGGLSL